MTRRVRLVAAGVGLALVCGGAYIGYDRLYARPAKDKQSRLESYLVASQRLEEELADEFRVRERLKEHAERTLGATAEVVEHRFRTGLGAIAAAAGLRDVVVSPNRPMVELNPAARERVRDFTRDQLRTADFYVVAGELRGRGTLAQATRALALAQSQPWIGRVAAYSIRPEGTDNREQFEVRITVQTLVLPDIAKDSDTTTPSLVEPSMELDRLASAVAARNVFAPPRPDPPRQQPREAQRDTPRPPPPPQYDQWRLNGVVSSGGEIEAWLVNVRHGEWLSLRVGEGVLDAVLVEVEGERAVFRIGEEVFQVALNETLAQRRPIR